MKKILEGILKRPVPFGTERQSCVFGMSSLLNGLVKFPLGSSKHIDTTGNEVS
jgi:hypothetical protein